MPIRPPPDPCTAWNSSRVRVFVPTTTDSPDVHSVRETLRARAVSTTEQPAQGHRA